jgi:chromosomal replication initiation ATPase DnaA
MNLSEICKEFNTTVKEIRQPGRATNTLVKKKKSIAFVLRSKYLLSYSEIADMMHVDHTTVIYYIKDINNTINLVKKLEGI